MYPPSYPAPSAFENTVGYYGSPNPVVMTSQPTVVMVAPQPAYKDYLGLSIMNIICCCLPLGIVALIFSIQTRDSVQRQDAASAATNSRTAFILNMVALGIGICIHLIWIAYVIYFFVVVGTVASTYYG